MADGAGHPGGAEARAKPASARRRVTFTRGALLAARDACVYEVRVRESGRLLALKEAAVGDGGGGGGALCLSRAAAARCAADARLLGGLRSRCVVACHAAQLVPPPGAPAFRMFVEALSGETLAAAARGPLPPAAAAGFVLQLARGLAALHACAVVHGGVCAANALMTERGTVKLTPFSVGARARWPAVAGGPGPSADVWDLGTTALSLLLGITCTVAAPELRGDGAAAGGPGALPPLPAGVPAAARAFVELCTSWSLAERPGAAHLLTTPWLRAAAAAPPVALHVDADPRGGGDDVASRSRGAAPDLLSGSSSDSDTDLECEFVEDFLVDAADAGVRVVAGACGAGSAAAVSTDAPLGGGRGDAGGRSGSVHNPVFWQLQARAGSMKEKGRSGSVTQAGRQISGLGSVEAAAAADEGAGWDSYDPRRQRLDASVTQSGARRHFVKHLTDAADSKDSDRDGARSPGESVVSRGCARAAARSVNAAVSQARASQGAR